MSITDELREYARHLHNVWYDPRGDLYTYTTMDNAPSLDAVRLDEHVLAIADRIDAEHERAVMSAMNDALCHANEKDMAELGWVRKNKEHVVAHAAIEVTPRIDWMRMADELDVFTQLVRGFAEQVEEDE